MYLNQKTQSCSVRDGHCWPVACHNFSVAPWQLSNNPVVRLAKSEKGREGSQMEL